MSPDGGVFAFGDGDEAPATAVTMRNVRSSMVNLEPDSGSSVGLAPINALLATELSTSFSWPQTGFGEITMRATLIKQAPHFPEADF